MPPRECDNDDCDYETYVDGEGRPRMRWEHVSGCTPMQFAPPSRGGIPPEYFLV